MKQVRPLEYLSPEDALKRQQELGKQLVLRPGPTEVKWIGACDVAYEKDRDIAHAGIVVLDTSTMEVAASASWSGEPQYGYVPGLFGLREASCILNAFEALEHRPDVLLVDGHGFAHPRRFGLACLLGWVMDLPTVGCAKGVLCGEFSELGSERGARAELVEGGQVIGHALRTQPGINPVFTSPGFGYDIDTATSLVLRYSGEFRIPEPLRQAHQLSIDLRETAA